MISKEFFFGLPQDIIINVIHMVNKHVFCIIFNVLKNWSYKVSNFSFPFSKRVITDFKLIRFSFIKLCIFVAKFFSLKDDISSVCFQSSDVGKHCFYGMDGFFLRGILRRIEPNGCGG